MRSRIPGAINPARPALAAPRALAPGPYNTLLRRKGTARQILRVNGSGVLGFGALIGSATNDSATAGDVGEYKSGVRTVALGLTTNVVAEVTSVALTAGDWNVWAVVKFEGNAATTVNQIIGYINNTTATGADAEQSALAGFGLAMFTYVSKATFVIGPYRRSLSGDQTVYLNALATFGTNTCSVTGEIYARRMR